MTAVGGRARLTVALVPWRGTSFAHVFFLQCTTPRATSGALRVLGRPPLGGRIVVVIGYAGGWWVTPWRSRLLLLCYFWDALSSCFLCLWCPATASAGSLCAFLFLFPFFSSLFSLRSACREELELLTTTSRQVCGTCPSILLLRSRGEISRLVAWHSMQVAPSFNLREAITQKQGETNRRQHHVPCHGALQQPRRKTTRR